MIVLFFFFCNEKLCTCFWKKLGLFSKNIKVFKDSNSAGFIVLLWNFSDAFSLEIPKKSVKKIVFFPDWYILENKTKTKQKNPQKVFEVLLLTIYLVICRKNIVNLLSLELPKAFVFQTKAIVFAKSKKPFSKMTY